MLGKAGGESQKQAQQQDFKMAPESRMTHARRTRRDNGGVEAAALR